MTTGVMGSATTAVAVTPSDVTYYDPPLKALWIGVSGNVNVDMSEEGESITFTGVPIGWLEVDVRKVNATLTTALNITGVR